MPSRNRLILAASLLFLMALTRTGHFGSGLSLPDASLAVLLLGGLWLGGAAWFAGFMALAVGMDVLAAKTAVEAGWCMTPAYLGLLPTYGAVWFAGRFLSRTPDLPWARFAGVGLAAILVAFAISNLTFWAFSGMFGGMGLPQYAAAVAKYFPPYLGSTALYLGLGWLAQRALGARLITA